MSENGTSTALVALHRPQHRGFARVAPDSAFVSQLIAERDHMAPQRTRRRATVGVAVGAYDTGSRIAIRRLPPGYRTSMDV
jgi:hypothetical protein